MPSGPWDGSAISPSCAAGDKALLKDAEERQDLFSMTNYRTEVMSLDLLADDDPAGAAGEIEDAMKHWSHRSFHAQHLFALVGGVRIELYRGQGAAARALIDAARRDYEASQLHRSCIGRINMYNILACSALAARPAGSGNLDREATAAAAGLDRERIPYASALAQMVRGRVASLRGDLRRAIRVYRDAAEAYRSLSMLLHEAATLARLGELLGGDEGHGLEGRSTDWMESQRIRNPAAMSARSRPDRAGVRPMDEDPAIAMVPDTDPEGGVQAMASGKQVQALRISNPRGPPGASARGGLLPRPRIPSRPETRGGPGRRQSRRCAPDGRDAGIPRRVPAVQDDVRAGHGVLRAAPSAGFALGSPSVTLVPAPSDVEVVLIVPGNLFSQLWDLGGVPPPIRGASGSIYPRLLAGRFLDLELAPYDGNETDLPIRMYRSRPPGSWAGSSTCSSPICPTPVMHH